MKVIDLIEMLNKLDPDMNLVWECNVKWCSVSICNGARIKMGADRDKVTITLSGDETDND